MPLVYVVDDDRSVLDVTRRWLEISDIDVKTFTDGFSALAAIKNQLPDALVCDVKMPKVDGFAVLAQVLDYTASLPVVMMTGHGDIAMAVEAMRKGAYDFIEKPYNPDHLSMVLHRAVEKRHLSQENSRLQDQLRHLSGIEAKIIGVCELTQKLRKNIIGLAAFDVNTLIYGDTGVGKELIASCLHEYSQRSDAAFVAINCGAIPENLLESELFGHEKGTFTGADKRRIGKLEHASDGVLFLDEIESMPMSFQVKLLRALQENTIERLGSNTSIAINPRVICATKVDLLALADKGTFRADLYYRLKVAELKVPNLNERAEDIPALFEYFLKDAEHKYQVQIVRPDAEEVACLLDHTWPGNIRELKNAAHRYAIESTINDQKIDSAFIASSGQLDVASHTDPLPAEPTVPEAAQRSLAEQVKAYEKQMICNALQKHNGRVQTVLDELSLNRRTLNIKMQQYGIKREQFLPPK